MVDTKISPEGRKNGRRDRKPYVAPTLQHYGSVSKLTGTSNGSGGDGGTGTMNAPMTMCL